VLLFHDSHHRSVTDPASMAAYDLDGYDGVLAFGDVIRDEYLGTGGPGARGRGTRPPIPASSTRGGAPRPAMWSGSATGEMRSGPRSSRSF
jgi:hypothetical protein